MCYSVLKLGGLGVCPPGKFWNLQPLRLFLMPSETSYCILILSHSTIYISIILGNFRGGGDPGAPPLCINP